MLSEQAHMHILLAPTAYMLSFAHVRRTQGAARQAHRTRTAAHTTHTAHHAVQRASIYPTTFFLLHDPTPFHPQVPELQLPIRFDTDVGGELADSVPGVGRSLSVSFNRCLAPASPAQSRLMRAGLLARHARADALLAQLHEASLTPEVDYVNPVIK